MTTQEFKDFCHEEFTKRGFVKKKLNNYYLNTDKGVLVSIYLQRSGYGTAYYINYNFYIGFFDKVKDYPPHYDSDLYHRICVLSKDTFKGEHFMDAMIELERYTIDEIKPYIDAEFDQYIMPVLTKGKQHIIDNLDHFFSGTPEERVELLSKLNS